MTSPRPIGIATVAWDSSGAWIDLDPEHSGLKGFVVGWDYYRATPSGWPDSSSGWLRISPSFGASLHTQSPLVALLLALRAPPAAVFDALLLAIDTTSAPATAAVLAQVYQECQRVDWAKSRALYEHDCTGARRASILSDAIEATIQHWRDRLRVGRG